MYRLYNGLLILLFGLCIAAICVNLGTAWAWESDTAADLSRAILLE